MDKNPGKNQKRKYLEKKLNQLADEEAGK